MRHGKTTRQGRWPILLNLYLIPIIQLFMKSKNSPVTPIFKFFSTLLSWMFKFFCTLLLIIGVVWFIDYLIPDDYCFEQHRKLTDKEYILIVLDKFIKEERIKVHDWDNTAETYLLHHPKCCSVTKGMVSSYYDSPEVWIHYEISDKFKEQYQTRYYDSITFVSACGEPFEFTGSP